MKHYPSGIGANWKQAGHDTTVLNWIKANPGKNETDIATGTGLTIDQVMWAIDQLYKSGEVALVPENWADFNNHPHMGRK